MENSATPDSSCNLELCGLVAGARRLGRNAQPAARGWSGMMRLSHGGRLYTSRNSATILHCSLNARSASRRQPGSTAISSA